MSDTITAGVLLILIPSSFSLFSSRHRRSYRYVCLDMRVRLIANKLKVRVLEFKYRFDSGIQLHHRRRIGFPRDLNSCLLQVVEVKVGVAEGMYEFTRFESAYMRDHHGKQRVGGNVEGRAQEDVGGPLIKLAGQLALCHVELKKGVARREGHALNLGNVP